MILFIEPPYTIIQNTFMLPILLSYSKTKVERDTMTFLKLNVTIQHQFN